MKRFFDRLLRRKPEPRITTLLDLHPVHRIAYQNGWAVIDVPMDPVVERVEVCQEG